MTGENAIGVAAEVVGHRFARPGLLWEALTHRSVGSTSAATYERLEFLGDRVLSLVVADMLITAFPTENQGDLSKRFAALVRGKTLADIARKMELGRFIRVARSEEHGRTNTGILGDVVEAVIGALYLDGGLPAARAFIDAHWRPLICAETEPPEDAKTQLQELLQAAGRPLPQYEIAQVTGPAHEPTFSAVLRVEGYPPVEANGNSKRAAEKAAARVMLEAVIDSGGVTR